MSRARYYFLAIRHEEQIKQVTQNPYAMLKTERTSAAEKEMDFDILRFLDNATSREMAYTA